jgi:ATP-binding cassette, subfamily B, bacterial CvaB/MchF/RaxB
MHLSCRPLRFELADLRQLQRPAILHWDMSHFVVLEATRAKGIMVHDPALGRKFYSYAEASKHLTGVALELTPAENFASKDERSRLPFSVFWSQLSGSTHALVQILLLSVVLEALVLVSPFYMQLTIDEVIVRGDLDLLLVLALGFALLMVIKTGTTAIRSSIILLTRVLCISGSADVCSGI